MKSFNDSEGRSWNLSLTIGSVKRVKDLLKVNLLEPQSGEPPVLTRLGTDILFIVDVIFCIVKPQADERNITDEQFASALGGNAILAAQTALYEELTDFFLSSGQTDKAKAMAAQGKILAMSVAAIAQKIEAVDFTVIGRKFDEIDLNAELNKTLGKSSISLQG